MCSSPPLEIASKAMKSPFVGHLFQSHAEEGKVINLTGSCSESVNQESKSWQTFPEKGQLSTFCWWLDRKMHVKFGNRPWKTGPHHVIILPTSRSPGDFPSSPELKVGPFPMVIHDLSHFNSMIKIGGTATQKEDGESPLASIRYFW